MKKTTKKTVSKKTTTRKIYRNGDYVFCEVKKSEKPTGKIVKHAGSFTFATGGATSHTHQINVKKASDLKLYKNEDGSYFLVLSARATITHPEHSEKVDLKVPAGVYKLFQKQEKDHFSGAVRKIID